MWYWKNINCPLSASALVCPGHFGHPVSCGPAVVPAGCAPVLVQAVLKGVAGGLLYIVRQGIVVLDHSVTEEVAPIIMLEVSWPDGMVSTSIPGDGGPLPPPVHLHVEPGRHTDPVLA